MWAAFILVGSLIQYNNASNMLNLNAKCNEVNLPELYGIIK